MAEEFAPEAERILGGLSALLGVQVPRPVVVVLAADGKQMRAALPGASGLAEWAAGAALVRRGVVLVDASAPQPERVLGHELAHLMLARLGAGKRIPRWFQEGFAQYTAEQWSFERARVLAWGAATGRLFSLDALEQDFPQDLGRARLAYAQSIDFIGFLLDRGAEERFSRLMSLMASGLSFRLALEEAYDIGAEELERQWFASINRRFTWIPLLTGTAALWAVAGAVLVVGYVRRRKLRRLQIEAMEDGPDLEAQDTTRPPLHG